MAINDLPMLSALRTKMQWHQERQRVLAENVSNANTPNYRPNDLVEPKFDKGGSSVVGGTMGSLAMARTSSSHMAVSAAGQSFRGDGGKSGFLTKPAGNAVNLEDQMMKVAANQMDYAAATSLYTRSLGLLKTAIGKR
ncbi:MAG: flagellar basal body rod protein FlgB [bacterium]|nr:flagellar basal body rod protein FlgB [bacterium]